MGILQERVAEARKIERNLLHGDARLCRTTFGIVCKAIWPVKTAEELASRIGCSVRTAAYEISGEHDPSARSIQAILNEIIPPRG